MRTNKQWNALVRVLEAAIEVMGIVIMVAPFLRSKARRKTK